MRAWLPFVLIAALFAVFMSAGAVLQPDTVRATNTTDQFDTSRALARLTRVLGDERPHPLDTDANDAVRDRILTEIRALGLTPRVRDDFVCNAHPQTPVIDCGRARNILFSIGPEAGPAILAMAHYDSAAVSPGASDDGAGVAVWLEVAQHLASQRLQRRVIFLLTDGEEVALFGASAFARDSAMRDVQAVINLEARGTRGPAVFFETRRPNADAVNAYSASAPRPVANSIMAAVYALLPNSTDVSAFPEFRGDVVNMAFIEGYENYHTPRDAIASLDPRSLQHMGDGALALARRFATNADANAQGSLAFTDIASRVFIAYPEMIGAPLLGAIAVFGFVLFFRGARDGRWRALFAPLVALVFAVLASIAIGAALHALRPGAYWIAHPETSRAWTFLVALLALLLALYRPARLVEAARVDLAAMSTYALFGALGSLALPGLSVLFLPPALVFALGAALGFRWPLAQRVARILAGLVAIAFWAPVLALGELALGYDLPALSVAFSLIALLPASAWLARAEASRAAPILATTAAALAAIAATTLLPGATAARPQVLNIILVQDDVAQRSRLVAGSAMRALPREIASAARFTREPLIQGDDQDVWATPIAQTSLPTPRVQIVSASGNDVRLRFNMNGAYRVAIRIPAAQRLLRVELNGAGAEPVLNSSGASADYVSVACQGRACDGAQLNLRFAAPSSPSEWRVLGQTLGAAPQAQALIARRPASRVPFQFGDSVITVGRPVAPGATAR